MMKIALIFRKSLLPIVFGQRTLEALSQLGQVSIHQEEDLTTEAVQQTLQGADIAVTSWGSLPLTEELLDVAPQLKLVIHAAGSVKPIVTDALWDRGIRVVTSTEPLGIGVAETALGFAISASKNFYRVNSDIHNGGWNEHRNDCRELYDLQVGVVSAGFVGRHFMKLLRNFEVDLLVYDPFVTPEGAEALGAKKVSLEELLEQSDILSIHAPSIPETYRMIDGAALKRMKKDAILINTSRGSVLDEQALYEHMKAGNLRYACLDVFDPEPPLADNPLRTLENVIMTPHLAGLVINGRRRIGAHVLRQIQNFLHDEPLGCEVKKEMLNAMA